MSGAVFSQQIRSSYSHLPLTLLVSVVNSTLVGFVLSAVASVSIVLIWIGLMVAQSAVRMLFWRAVCRGDAGAAAIHPWSAHIQITGLLVSGILWGSVPFLFAPLSEAHLLFVALVIAGMCAGAATVHAAYFPAVLAFIVPALALLTVNFFINGGRLQTIAGIMTCIFGITLCITSLKFRRWFNDTLLARLELDEANQRLTAEIASHQSTEEKLQQSQKLEAVGRLTAGVAHDFNNLLMSISGSAGLIAMRLPSDSVCAPYLATMMQSVERGTNLTRRLLAFGRKQNLTPRSVDINEMLRGAEKLLLTTLGGYSKLLLQLENAPMVAFVDAAQLEHAILNLIINARDAMPNGGVVTISTASVTLEGMEVGTEGLIGRFVRIAVSDTGTGMSDSVRLQAFDPFFTTKDVGEGTGLGLSQVYGLVQQSGGLTKIESEIGQGTTVVIYLPHSSTEAPRDPPPIRQPAVAASPGRRILVVDDDEQARETVAAMLETAGYLVVSFATARQALHELEEATQIDLLVVDFAMPDMRGDQFAAEARLLRPTVPILFVTGYAEPTSLQSERFVLEKPFRAASLISAAENAMQTVVGPVLSP
jgi:signal transduction histidine kinase